MKTPEEKLAEICTRVGGLESKFSVHSGDVWAEILFSPDGSSHSITFAVRLSTLIHGRGKTAEAAVRNLKETLDQQLVWQRERIGTAQKLLNDALDRMNAASGKAVS